MAIQGNCPICKKETIYINSPGGLDAFDFDCERCGKFRITGTAAATDLGRYVNLNLLSGIVRNLYEEGEKLYLDTESIKKLAESVRIPTDPFEIIDLLLEHILKKSGKIVNPIKFNPENDYPLLYLENSIEFAFFVNKAKELGYIEFDRSQNIRLTLEGWKHISEIRKNKQKSDQAFVAMWFSEEMNDVWENGFQPALVEVGYKPIRIDLQEHNEKICDKIVAEIRNSGLVVADFTGQRGGVYFEAGFALGLNIPVIWTCKDTDVDNLHFDTRQYNHIVWSNPEDLKNKLINRIRATVLKI